jgi:predicted nucleic acid-binding protein
VEFASALAREVRVGSLSQEAAIEANAEFAETTTESFVIILPTAHNFDLAGEFLRRYETGLRPADALHLAIASNNRATAVCSLDRTFLTAGRRLGLKMMTGIRVRRQ